MWEQEQKLAAVNRSERYTCYAVRTGVSHFVSVKYEVFAISKVVNSSSPTRMYYTGRFVMFSVIKNTYNKNTKGPTLMELFTATGKLKKFFVTTRDVR